MASLPHNEQFDLNRVLSALGLNDREKLLYSVFLDGASRPASVLSKQTGLKRGQTYDVLADLEKKGIVQEFTKGNTRYFCASAPDGLLALLESREAELTIQKSGIQQLAYTLAQNFNGSIHRPRVCYYHGAEGVKQIFDSMLRTPDSDIYLILDTKYLVQASVPALSGWFDGWIAKRVERNVWSHGIYTKTELGDRYLSRPGMKRNAKRLDNVDLPVQINVWADKIALISSHSEISGVVIEDDRYAAALRELHRALWRFLPEYNEAPRAHSCDTDYRREATASEPSVI